MLRQTYLLNYQSCQTLKQAPLKNNASYKITWSKASSINVKQKRYLQLTVPSNAK